MSLMSPRVSNPLSGCFDNTDSSESGSTTFASIKRTSSKRTAKCP